MLNDSAEMQSMRMKSKFSPSRYFLTSIILYFSAVGMAAQVPPKDEASKSSLLIKSNVLIVDAAGQYADDVGASDIKLFENGIEQKITYFAKKEPGSRICIVIDNSGSMNYKQSLASSIGKAIVDNLGTKDESMLIRFVSRDKITIEEKWTTDKKLMREALDNLFIEGGQSAVIDGIYLALEMMLKSESEAKSKRHAIVVITDGDDRDSYFSMKDLRKLFGNTDVQIFALAFTDGIKDPPNDMMIKKDRKREAEKLLRSITGGTSGIPYFFDETFTQSTITEALRSLLIELRSQFVIGYTPNNKKNVPRNLSIIVSDAQKAGKELG
ncbi:MAG: VWA domain-containing protein [Blastocatellia bacterium]